MTQQPALFTLPSPAAPDLNDELRTLRGLGERAGVRLSARFTWYGGEPALDELWLCQVEISARLPRAGELLPPVLATCKGDGETPARALAVATPRLREVLARLEASS